VAALFTFKSTAKEYEAALGRLNAVETELTWVPEDNTVRLEELSVDVRRIVSSTRSKPISHIVWGRHAGLGIPITLAMVIVLLGGAELMVGRYGKTRAPADCETHGVGTGESPGK
jgi:hypothetical protein